jgi:hypothetical protein
MPYHNDLPDDGVGHLSKALSTNNLMLKTLGLGLGSNQSLIVLGLVFNEITDQGVKILAHTIAYSNTNIQVLYL